MQQAINAYQTHQQQALTDILSQNEQLVRKIGYSLLKTLPDSVDLDDLLQEGRMALIEAFQRYKSDKGASFEQVSDAFYDSILRMSR